MWPKVTIPPCIFTHPFPHHFHNITFSLDVPPPPLVSSPLSSSFSAVCRWAGDTKGPIVASIPSSSFCSGPCVPLGPPLDSHRLQLSIIASFLPTSHVGIVVIFFFSFPHPFSPSILGGQARDVRSRKIFLFWVAPLFQQSQSIVFAIVTFGFGSYWSYWHIHSISHRLLECKCTCDTMH